MVNFNSYVKLLEGMWWIPKNPSRKFNQHGIQKILLEYPRTFGCRIWTFPLQNADVSGCRHTKFVEEIDIDTLWWTNKKQWKDPPFFMRKSTISTGPFSSSQTVRSPGRVCPRRTARPCQGALVVICCPIRWTMACLRSSHGNPEATDNHFLPSRYVGN